MSVQIIGAGFGRTGTTSLKLALEQLGYAPCYHMFNVIENPGEALAWEKAAAGATPDWAALLGGQRAVVDWPASFFWRELAEAFPSAKVILTVRDAGQWHASIQRTIGGVLAGPQADQAHASSALLHMARFIIGQLTFAGRMNDPQHAIAVYHQHNAEVQRVIAKDRLLVYDLADGWGPLCGFLGVAEPGAPMPKVNTTDEFRSRILGG